MEAHISTAASNPILQHSLIWTNAREYVATVDENMGPCPLNAFCNCLIVDSIASAQTKQMHSNHFYALLSIYSYARTAYDRQKWCITFFYTFMNMLLFPINVALFLWFESSNSWHPVQIIQCIESTYNFLCLNISGLRLQDEECDICERRNIGVSNVSLNRTHFQYWNHGYNKQSTEWCDGISQWRTYSMRSIHQHRQVLREFIVWLNQLMPFYDVDGVFSAKWAALSLRRNISPNECNFSDKRNGGNGINSKHHLWTLVLWWNEWNIWNIDRGYLARVFFHPVAEIKSGCGYWHPITFH